MKTLPAGLQDHLDSGTTTLCWCWRVRRTDGTVFGFTEFDESLTFDGTTFEPDSGLTASEIRAGSDMAADSQEAEGILRSDAITETDILDGLWDGAEIEVWRVNWQQVAQRVLMRAGSIGQIRRGRASFVAECRSLAHLLQQTVGRIYGGSCDAEVGDARCGADLSGGAYTGTGEITTLLDGRTMIASGLDDYDTDWFSLGKVIWLTGANAGRESRVVLHSNNLGYVAIVIKGLPVRPAVVGDQFSIVAGCDKTLTPCATKFFRTISFRGFPDIPGQDVLTRYAADGDANAGGAL